MPKGESVIKNDMESTMKIGLQTKINQRLLGNYTNTSVDSSMRISTLPGQVYEMYPKVWFYGDSSKTITQHRLFADLTINELKEIIDIYLKTNNAGNIVWYIDYTSGEQKIIDFTTIR